MGETQLTWVPKEENLLQRKWHFQDKSVTFPRSCSVLVSYPPGILGTQAGPNHKTETPLTPSASPSTRCAKERSRGELIILPLRHRCFLIIRLGLYVFRRKSTEVKCHSYHIVRVYTLCVLSLLMLTLITWLEVLFVRFLSCKVAPFFSPSILRSLEESPYVQPKLKE